MRTHEVPLSNTRYDEHDFEDPACCEVLSRYFTRLMMIVAEHLADLQKINQKMGTPNAKAAREGISPAADRNWVDNFHKFVNRVCKHKTEGQNIHFCNHHLPYCFGDMKEQCVYQSNSASRCYFGGCRFDKVSEIVRAYWCGTFRVFSN